MTESVRSGSEARITVDPDPLSSHVPAHSLPRSHAFLLRAGKKKKGAAGRSLTVRLAVALDRPYAGSFFSPLERKHE